MKIVSGGTVANSSAETMSREKLEIKENRRREGTRVRKKKKRKTEEETKRERECKVKGNDI